VTESILDLRFSQRVPPGPVKKKRVLLVDNTRATRDLRAEVMRKRGIDVDCAADMTEARVWWRADLYDLVLISAATEHGRRDKFCEHVRGATPSQHLAFLVGKPEYLADSPNPDDPISASEDHGNALLDDVRDALATHAAENKLQKWGILQACQRIAVVRASADARTKAIRQRPAPPRDSEASRTARDKDSQILSGLAPEEMQ
jgi:CheY-like chemotaxis protein